MTHATLQVRRKSAWRSKNNGRAAMFSRMRAAKERKRMERVNREEPLPDCSHVVAPKAAKPLFVVTIRCRDGERVALPIHETPWGTLSVSPTRAGRQIACVLANYRPL